MTIRNHIEHRQAMEQLLADRADRALELLHQRARKVGTSPRRLLNQIAPNAETSPEDTSEKAHIVRTLLQRMKDHGNGA